MRSLDYFVAVTLDGFIAGPDGAFDFFGVDPDYLAELNADWGDGLPTGLHDALGLTPPGTRWDTVVMGRGAFQPALDAQVADPYAHLRTVVYSSTLDPADHPGVEIVATDPVDHVRALKAEDGLAIWLCGGARLAGTLIDEIDRLVLKINPVTIGAGLPLWRTEFAARSWRLAGTARTPGV